MERTLVCQFLPELWPGEEEKTDDENIYLTLPKNETLRRITAPSIAHKRSKKPRVIGGNASLPYKRPIISEVREELCGKLGF